MYKAVVLTSLLLTSPSFAGQYLEIENKSDGEIIIQYYSGECSFGTKPCRAERISPQTSYTYTDPQFFKDPRRIFTVYKTGVNAYAPQISVHAAKYSKCQVTGNDATKEHLEVQCLK